MAVAEASSGLSLLAPLTHYVRCQIGTARQRRCGTSRVVGSVHNTFSHGSGVFSRGCVFPVVWLEGPTRRSWPRIVGEP